MKKKKENSINKSGRLINLLFINLYLHLLVFKIFEGILENNSNYFHYQYFEISNQINIHYNFIKNYLPVKSVHFSKSEYRVTCTKNKNNIKIMCV